MHGATDLTRNVNTNEADLSAAKQPTSLAKINRRKEEVDRLFGKYRQRDTARWRSAGGLFGRGGGRRARYCARSYYPLPESGWIVGSCTCTRCYFRKVGKYVI